MKLVELNRRDNIGESPVVQPALWLASSNQDIPVSCLTAMSRKKLRYELPDEVLAVLECSPNLMPCKKFLHANIYRFWDHMENDRCQQCIEWFWQTDKELRTMKLLARWRKHRDN